MDNEEENTNGPFERNPTLHESVPNVTQKPSLLEQSYSKKWDEYNETNQSWENFDNTECND